MSKHRNQGPVADPIRPEPPAFHPDDPARVEPPEAPQQPEAPAPGPTADSTAVAPPFIEPFEPPNGVPAVTEKDREIAEMALPIEPEAPAIEDPQRRGKPLPDGAVMVKALSGVIVRVEHREPGQQFWMYEAEAKEFESRGWVELLK